MVSPKTLNNLNSFPYAIDITRPKIDKKKEWLFEVELQIDSGGNATKKYDVKWAKIHHE